MIVGAGWHRSVGATVTPTPAFSPTYPAIDNLVADLGDVDWQTQTGGQDANGFANIHYTLNQQGWNAGVGGTGQLVLDHGAAVGGDRFIVTGYYGSNTIYRPTGYAVAYSDDNVAWTTVASASGLTGGGQPGTHSWLVNVDISAAGDHRYWRVILTSGGPWLFVTEVGIIESADPGLFRPVTFWDAPDASYPDMAVDVVKDSYADWSDDQSSQLVGVYRAEIEPAITTTPRQWIGWNTGAGGGTITVEVDLESAVELSSVRITGTYDDSHTVYKPSGVTVLYSDDDVNWFTAAAVTGMTPGTGGFKPWIADFAVAVGAHRYWAVQFNQDNDWLFVGSIELLSVDTWRLATLGKPTTQDPAPYYGDVLLGALVTETDSDWANDAYPAIVWGNFGVSDDYTLGWVGYNPAAGADVTLRMDLGEAVAIDHFVLHGKWGSSGGNVAAPQAFDVLYSDDDVAYTSAGSVSGFTADKSGSSRWIFAMDVSAESAHRYWKLALTCSSVAGDRILVSQVVGWVAPAAAPTPPTPSTPSNRMGGTGAIRKPPRRMAS